MVVWLAMLLGCGGGTAPPPGPDDAKSAKAKKGKKKRGKKGKQPEPEPKDEGFVTGDQAPKHARLKIRPPFFAMPPSIAKGVVGGETGRELIVPVQKGPFGPSDSTLTLFYRHAPVIEGQEPVHELGLMVVLEVEGKPTGIELPVVNDKPVVGDPGLLWVNGDTGWLPVLLIERQGADEIVRENQAFSWTGQGFVHAEAEPRIRSLDPEDEEAFHTSFY